MFPLARFSVGFHVKSIWEFRRDLGDFEWGHLRLSKFCLQEAAKLKYESEQLPVFLEHLNRVLLQNRDGDGFFVGDQVPCSPCRLRSHPHATLHAKKWVPSHSDACCVTRCLHVVVQCEQNFSYSKELWYRGVQGA